VQGVYVSTRSAKCAIEIDDMEPLCTLRDPVLRHCSRVVTKYGFCLRIALAQPHAAAMA
jgi:hypothetical protein